MSSYWGLAAAPPPGTPRPEWANVWPEFDPFRDDPRSCQTLVLGLGNLQRGVVLLKNEETLTNTISKLATRLSTLA